MKHLITLISALVFMSATVHADDIKKNKKHKNQAVAVAPFVWGNSEEAPLIVETLKMKNASVPVAKTIALLPKYF